MLLESSASFPSQARLDCERSGKKKFGRRIGREITHILAATKDDDEIFFASRHQLFKMALYTYFFTKA